MNIKELENKHYEIIGESDLGIIDELEDSIDYGEEAIYTAQRATKLSIQFAIEVLEGISKCIEEDIEQEDKLTEWGLGYQQCSKDITNGLYEKIQELKQYLDEKI